ncbi:MAG: 7-cyano-7-deazaguanine synthase QueC [Thermodesulfobacteriota bacterium]
MTASAEPAKAIVLLSGGLDSTTVLAAARQEGYACYCLSFDYGQRQRLELERARQAARAFGAAGHLVLRLELNRLAGSALLGHQPVPKDRPDLAEIPSTYVPARNTVFLSLALAWAETLGAADIFIGANAIDYSGYPDCRPAFLAAFEAMANLGTRAGVEGGRPFRLHAPLLAMTKAEIIRLAIRLGVDLAATHSCYDPDPAGRACGACDACRLRQKGFAEAGVADPTVYQPP